jgi:UPF0716 protein FxsA
VGIILLVAFLVVPIAELAVLIKVGSTIGVVDTIILMLLISAVGAWLVKRAGVSVVKRIRSQLELGRVPGAELVDGFLVMLAGALMLTPGFLSDCVALLLLVPPVRAAVRKSLRRRFERQMIIR